jgi:hypothetical protein
MALALSSVDEERFDMRRERSARMQRSTREDLKALKTASAERVVDPADDAFDSPGKAMPEKPDIMNKDNERWEAGAICGCEVARRSKGRLPDRSVKNTRYVRTFSQ